MGLWISFGGVREPEKFVQADENQGLRGISMGVASRFVIGMSC